MKNESTELKQRNKPYVPFRAVRDNGSNAIQVSAANAQNGLVLVQTNELREIVAQAAYYRAQLRRFQPGFELEDWLAAERQVAAICNAVLKIPLADAR